MLRGLLSATVFVIVIAWAPHSGARDGVRFVALTDPGMRIEDDRSGLLPLSAADAVRYQRIHRLQEAGDWDAADVLIGWLDDPVLLPDVLVQRFLHPTAYRSRYDELTAWLERYADHPDAPRVHRLALARRPAGTPPPPRPVPGYLAGAGQELREPAPPPYRTTRERSPEQDALVQEWRRAIAEVMAREGPGEALRRELDRDDVLPLIDDVEYDLARWAIARRYFSAGEFEAALRLADAAARSGGAEPRIHWTAGLAAWRLNRTSVAARHFGALADSRIAPASEVARAAFWAARAHMVGGKPQLFHRYIRLAMERDHGFYGLLARAVFGEEPRFTWYEEGLEDGLLQVLLEHPGARRALALAQIGQHDRAEREIRKLGARARAELCLALVALAEALKLPAAEMRVAQRLKLANGHHHHGALFPVPAWEPAGGFRLDRALIFAVARAESGFDPWAESPVGARGLMQLMPLAVREAAGRLGLTPPKGEELFEPQTNLALGQAYLERLLETSAAGDNLIYLAAGYNCGPTCLARWRRSLGAEDDPLLFLESLPAGETRAYVKKVLLNLWTYRARLGQPIPSLNDLAENRWPTYRALDSEPRAHAWR